MSSLRAQGNNRDVVKVRLRTDAKLPAWLGNSKGSLPNEAMVLGRQIRELLPCYALVYFLKGFSKFDLNFNLDMMPLFCTTRLTSLDGYLGIASMSAVPTHMCSLSAPLGLSAKIQNG